VHGRRIEGVAHRLGDAALDPSMWPEVMEEICRAVGASGAALFQSDVRTTDVPGTARIDELSRAYFGDNWHTRDLRTRGVPVLLSPPEITDEDRVTPEEIRREPLYNDFLIPQGFQWFAGVGFWAGPALWALSIQRTFPEGPFTLEDNRLLAELAPHLTEAATLSTAVGRCTIAGMTNALNLVRQPALALDRMGCVLDANAAAQALFDDDVRESRHRLVIRDSAAATTLADLLDQMRATPETIGLIGAPIIVRRARDRPLLIRVLPVGGAACCPFLGACALLVLTDLRAKPDPDPVILARAFGLTRAEARLASLVAGGMAPDAAAAKSRNLARYRPGSAEGGVRQDGNPSAERTRGAALAVGLLITGAGWYRPRRPMSTRSLRPAALGAAGPLTAAEAVVGIRTDAGTAGYSGQLTAEFLACEVELVELLQIHPKSRLIPKY
jgi:hypothetical protein